MKPFLFCLLSFFLISTTNAQVSYYRGEWSKLDSKELFPGLCRIEIKKDGTLKATLLWTYKSCDSADAMMMEMYKGKKGRKAIELAEGEWNAGLNEISFEGKDRIDPYEVISQDSYHLKLSSDGKVLYGTTNSNGSNKGLFYAIKTDAAAAQKELQSARAALLKVKQ